MKINEQFLAQMREATQLLQGADPMAATAAIQRALGGMPGPETVQPHSLVDINPAAGSEPVQGAGFGQAWEAIRGAAAAKGWKNPLGGQDVEDVQFHEAAPKMSEALPGKFISGSCSNRAGTRSYKLYIPSSYQGEAVPLIVMLHGCKQHPDDFAAGTGMNRLAEERHCLVLYPAQAAKANGSNCWNWFNPHDQERDRGEPSILADMTRQVMREYQVDSERVYVAGLSAGGAMAAIMAARYPDLFAAVGIHSGLPVGSAHDVASAFGAMKQGHKGALPAYRQPVPAIVFHGDRDHTVQPGNGTAALAQCVGGGSGRGMAEAQTRKSTGKVANGRAYTQTVFVGEGERSIAEHWVVHGSGHAWSGGSKAGSYTDPKGPDASAEMLRFFYAHPKQGQAR